MDRERFDALARLFATRRSRRSTLAVWLGAAFFGRGLDHGDAKPKGAEKRHSGRKRRDKEQRRNRGRSPGKDQPNHGQRGKRDSGRRRRVRAQAAPAGCFPGSPCIPGPGANLVGCDFEGSSELKHGCQSCDLSKANLKDAYASGGDLSGADLSDACLVDTDFNGADLTGATTSGAIFCRTTLPDGSIDNSGCGNGTACCPTCQEIGGVCGAGLGGDCCGGATCVNGACSCPAAKPYECAGVCQECCADNQCPSNVCCANACCAGGDICDTRSEPDICCTPDPPQVTCSGLCGMVINNCGQQVTCPPCSNPTPICSVRNVCEPCDGDEQCGVGSVCCAGSCVAGVCCEDAQCAPSGNECVGNACFCSGAEPCSGVKPDCCGLPGTCIDTDVDATNCGACGIVCPPQTAPACVQGLCVCPANNRQPCGPTETCCASGCHDLQTDPANCAACGHACAAAEVCAAGVCVCPGSANQPCGPGLTCCASGCEDLTSNAKNCGACDAACPTGAICQAGVCHCPAHHIACGNQCVVGICCELGETCTTVWECCANNRPGAPQNRVCCRDRIASAPGTECCLRSAAIGEPPTPCRSHSDCCSNLCIGGRCRGGLRAGGPDCYP